jgi:fatty acid desaturase
VRVRGEAGVIDGSAIDDGAIESRRLGGMVLPRELLAPGRDTELVRPDGRPQPDFRAELRRIPSIRNALSVVGLYLQTALVVWATIRFGPWAWPIGFVLMGRTHAQFASLMHEAAHRLLFANRKANDFVGRWMLGYPSFTSTDAYRRVHMAHHRQEFGPDEPDIPLYIGYPIGAASLRRKLVRDLTGRTGLRLLREQSAGFRSSDHRVRRTLWKIVAVQVALFAVSIAAGYPLVYPLLWFLPFLTVWRVINRLRSIAEHGGLEASSDRRVTTHSVRQHPLGRFLLVPYNIGWHLAHHVDAGVPFRNLPRYHRAMIESGYVGAGVEYASYRTIWRALAADRPS